MTTGKKCRLNIQNLILETYNMSLPSFPNSISAQQINTELLRSASNTISLNETSVRALAGKPSGTIAYANLHGKSAYREFFIFIIGAGGGGGGGGILRPGGGGGGGAVQMVKGNLATGSVWSITIGVGGSAGVSTNYGGSAGTGGTTTFALTSGGTGATSLGSTNISASGGFGGKNSTANSSARPGPGGNGASISGLSGGVGGAAPQTTYGAGQAYGGGGGGGGAGTGSALITLFGNGSNGASGTGPNTGGFGGTGKYLNLYPVHTTYPNTVVSGGGSGGPQANNNPGGGGWVTASNPPTIVLPSAAGAGGGGSMWGNGTAGYRGEVQIWYQASSILSSGGSAAAFPNGWVLHTFTSNGSFTAG